MRIPRNDQEGFDWTERTVGGRIIKKTKHVRWRPQWFLDIELPDGTVRSVVLRGFRNPGYTATDEKGARETLATEAEILRLLQDLPVTVPLFYGHDEENGWMLMERVEGDSELTDISDPGRRFGIFQGYMEELARLHAHPLEKITLPGRVYQPPSGPAHLETLIKASTEAYRAIKRTQPEPILELGLQWLGDNHLSSERPLCLGLGDVGPNQFLFVDSQFRSLIDFEFGMIADPLMEIGMMRVRELMYSIGRLPEHIIYYGQCFEGLTGIPLDLDALRYLTVAGAIIFNLPTAAGTNHPDPTMLDVVFLLAWETQAQRGIVEAMAEYYGIRLTPPDLPTEGTSMLGPLHQTMIGQLEQYFLPRAEEPEDQAFARYSVALARTLARGGATSRRLDKDNRSELVDLLGHDVDDWYEGLYELEGLIRDDYARDLERRLNFLYRVWVRREYLYEPMQRATGLSSGTPLGRFDDLEGVVPSTVPLPTSREIV